MRHPCEICGLGQGRRANRAASGFPARAAGPMPPRSWPDCARSQSASHQPIRAAGRGSPSKASHNAQSRCDRSRYARRPAPTRARGHPVPAPAHGQALRRPRFYCGPLRCGRAGITRPRSRRVWRPRAFASRRKIRRPRGDDDMPAFQTRHEFRHFSDGGAVVNVVEDRQPSRIGLEPAQDGGDLGCIVARLFLWQVENFEGR